LKGFVRHGIEFSEMCNRLIHVEGIQTNWASVAECWTSIWFKDTLLFIWRGYKKSLYCWVPL